MKKLNKFFAVLVALAMMATLAVTSAFALDDDQQPAAADAKLFKYLELAESVTNPNIEFTFNFEAGANTANVTTPTINPVKITPTQKTTADNDANSVYGVKTFAEILTGVDFPAAGVYTYTVTEAAPSDANVTPGNETYTVRIYVDKDKNVTHVTATKDGKNKEKVQVDEPVVDENTGIKIQGLTFDNKYVKNEEVTPDPENDLYGVLNIAKKVDTTSGDEISADRADDTFKFILTLTKAYGAPDEVPAAKVHPKTGADYAYAGDLVYGDNEITLKAGEVFYFPTLPAGTKWTVKEDLPNSTNAKKDQYQAAYVVTTSDDTADLVKSGDAAAGAALPAGSTYLLKEDTAGEKAVYTNTYDDKLDEPEGILMSNLPYIALALVAIGGLVAYVVVRRRNADEA